jgi:hypothetical protein
MSDLLLSLHQIIIPSPRLTLRLFCNMTRFYGEELLALGPTPKLKDHPLSTVSYFVFNIFATSFLNGGLSSIHNLVIRTHLSLPLKDTNNYIHHM